MKPLGIGLKLCDGAVVVGVTPIDRTADDIWAAVESAIASGWTVSQFKSEAAQAWDYALREQAKQAVRDMNAK